MSQDISFYVPALIASVIPMERDFLGGGVSDLKRGHIQLGEILDTSFCLIQVYNYKGKDRERRSSNVENYCKKKKKKEKVDPNPLKQSAFYF